MWSTIFPGDTGATRVQSGMTVAGPSTQDGKECRKAPQKVMAILLVAAEQSRIRKLACSVRCRVRLAHERVLSPR